MLLRRRTIFKSFNWSNKYYLLQNSPIAFNFLTSEPEPHHDLTFIRHAQSIYNKACQDYRKTHNIPYVWKQLLKHQGFQEDVMYNPIYMDAPLTQKGKSQCKNAQQIMAQRQVDCVLVSPQIRALQTCENIFKNQSIPIIVEPLLIGPIRSVCDVNKSTLEKKNRFPKYDFSEVQKHQQLWFLKFLIPQQKKILNNHFRIKNFANIEDKRIEVVKLLRQRKIFQDSITFRYRIQEIKQRIRLYKKKYERIALVSHYYNVQYLGATQYKKDGSPKPYMDIKNCMPYFASFKDLHKRFRD